MSDVDFTDNSSEVMDEFEAKIQKALEKIGLVAEGYAKRLCPVDTGRLRNSISHSNDDTFAYIGTNVEYAAYVELGTVVTRAQPYLKPAVADHADQYVRIAKDILKSE